MMCKECIHYGICDMQEIRKENGEYTNYKPCQDFKDKSLVVELPCKAGDTVYTDICQTGNGDFIDESVISEICFNKDYKEPLFTALCYEKAEYQRYWLSDFGKEIFLEPHFSEKKKH